MREQSLSSFEQTVFSTFDVNLEEIDRGNTLSCREIGQRADCNRLNDVVLGGLAGIVQMAVEIAKATLGPQRELSRSIAQCQLARGYIGDAVQGKIIQKQ